MGAASDELRSEVLGLLREVAPNTDGGGSYLNEAGILRSQVGRVLFMGGIILG